MNLVVGLGKAKRVVFMFVWVFGCGENRQQFVGGIFLSLLSFRDNSLLMPSFFSFLFF